MSFPDHLEEEPAETRPEIDWGVSRDPEPSPRPLRLRSGQALVSRLIWIILTILIILSLTLPWILPYLFPRRVPLRDGLQAAESQRIGELAGIAESPIRQFANSPGVSP